MPQLIVHGDYLFKKTFVLDFAPALATINQKRESLGHEVVLAAVLGLRYSAITSLRECGR